MTFRYDINGLRAIAVIAVVLFHFNANWLPGGFAGVDVFFVISGFLMTGIIFKGMENNTFNLFKFYVARSNRIIPPLTVLCLIVLAFGWFYLTPPDYKSLGKHAASSMGFLSNVIYWRESGYFSSASHEKWLLHTWSLSVEWQFYIIYPVVLLFSKKFFSITNLKRFVLLSTLLGFSFSVIATFKWPDSAYYLLPTRAWQMMIGGVAFLYPLNLSTSWRKLLEALGLFLILITYIFVSSDTPWPGYLSLAPVIGAYLVIVANLQSSFISNNFIFQSLGKWSYSIYLWHWPVVVYGYYFEIENWYLYGLPLSVILGFASFKYIESARFKSFSNWREIIKIKPLYFALLPATLSVVVFISSGFYNRMPSEYSYITSLAVPSPYRNKCHVDKYRDASQACQYFNENVKWATLGDSHTVEVAYALAEKLKDTGEGIKHFSFSGCRPSYGQSNDFSQCAKWYNDSINYIINDSGIDNVILNHRYSLFILGNHLSNYPYVGLPIDGYELILDAMDKAIFELSKHKDRVYVYYPIPEIRKPIGYLFSRAWLNNEKYDEILGTTIDFYNNRNEVILNKFKSKSYPENVVFLDPRDAFCDDRNCFATKGGIPLYFDSDHPSVAGARLLVDLIPMKKI